MQIGEINHDLKQIHATRHFIFYGIVHVMHHVICHNDPQYRSHARPAIEVVIRVGIWICRRVAHYTFSRTNGA